MTRQQLTDAIEKYRPYNEQEEMDQPLILNWIKNEKDAFLRENNRFCLGGKQRQEQSPYGVS